MMMHAGAVYDTGAVAAEPERAVFVYDTRLEWLEPDKADEPCRYCKPDHLCWTHRDTPDGFHRNGTNARYGSVEAVTETELIALYPADKVVKAESWKDFTAEPRLLVQETWWCTWFSHSQPDWGDDNAAVLASFRRYIDRVQLFNETWEYEHGERTGLCLMGAEDRWRWSARHDPAEVSHDTRPPCRCTSCKEAKVVRIDH